MGNYTNIKMKIIKILFSCVILLTCSHTAIADSVIKLEDDIVEYCKQIEATNSAFYNKDRGECDVFIQRLERKRAKDQFKKFDERYRKLLENNKNDRNSEIEQILKYWSK